MIDVMLVLLIIFMISLPWITQGFPAMLPSAAHSESDPDVGKDFVVGLDESGGLHWKGRAVTEAQLRDQLA
ncbi:MAG TPA: biopolymer transporter ExbD, partial [Gemmatimonadales bacterium]|nr:biopolymer transporter ExbD [Gemmatimonadales bacterium]